MRTKDALRVAVIALAGVAGLDVLGQAVASADEVQEFYGTGFRSPSTVVTSTEILSDCGDNNPSTNVFLFTIMGNVSYTGINIFSPSSAIWPIGEPSSRRYFY